MKKTILILAAAAAVLVYITQRTTRENPLVVPNFQPIRDDVLAQKYRPYLLSSPHGKPLALYYRASRSDGKVYITYHFLWEKEENPAPGFKPWLSRQLYTGGLALQRRIFGKGDIEMVSLVIDPAGQVESVEYETAENHSPEDFSVRHKTVQTRAQPPLVFSVISWNHLFSLESSPPDPSQWIDLDSEYFTRDLWEEYEMVKPKETLLKRSRAHQPYERQPVN